MEFRVTFMILEQVRFQGALRWICVSLLRIRLSHNLLHHVLSNISESSSITPPYLVFPNIPQYLYQAFLFFLWIFAKASSRWGKNKMFNVANCQLFSAPSINHLGHTFSLSLGSNLLLSLVTLRSKSRHKIVEEKQLWETVFFTGLSRKITEEKRHLSFEIDYFHSEVGKGKKHDSNKGLLLHLCLQILHIFQKISNISTCEKLAQEKNTSTNTFLESISRERKREKSGCCRKIGN